MKAKYNPKAKTKYTRSHRKEESGSLNTEIAALVPSPYNKTEMRAVVTLRTYNTSTRGSNTACLWANNDTISVNGSGSAGGYGYHRPSAAAQEAINNAGFSLSEDIDGRGDASMREAVLAIAKALGYRSAKLHTAHP